MNKTTGKWKRLGTVWTWAEALYTASVWMRDDGRGWEWRLNHIDHRTAETTTIGHGTKETRGAAQDAVADGVRQHRRAKPVV